MKMFSTDNLEAFLELFECVAAAWGWPEEEWALTLLPLLSREAQLASQQLPPQTKLEYSSIKRHTAHQPDPQGAPWVLPVAAPLRGRMPHHLHAAAERLR